VDPDPYTDPAYHFDADPDPTFQLGANSTKLLATVQAITLLCIFTSGVSLVLVPNCVKRILNLPLYQISLLKDLKGEMESLRREQADTKSKHEEVLKANLRSVS
jgi:hypothetical protein